MLSAIMIATGMMVNHPDIIAWKGAANTPIDNPAIAETVEYTIYESNGLWIAVDGNNRMIDFDII